MKLSSWQLIIGVALIAASASVYAVQFAFFGRPGDTLFYMLQDLAFVPVQVLLVTVILNELIRRREKAVMLNKMNMVIGAFFSGFGLKLLKSLSAFEAGSTEINGRLVFTPEWTDYDFKKAAQRVRGHEFLMDASRGDLAGLKALMESERAFLLGLLENPNLLEHETFTELLWAVMHLAEELARRDRLTGLPEHDTAHLGGDIKRAYAALLAQWLAYNGHLKEEYPYIFSLAMRTNPFDPNAKVSVE